MGEQVEEPEAVTLGVPELLALLEALAPLLRAAEPVALLEEVLEEDQDWLLL